MLVLPESFYAGEVTDVARNLLGKRLERNLDGVLLSGIITETEAYRGEEDLACHARSGRTRRTAVMYGLPGRAYVYFTYGMHWCFNAVCGPSGFPAAVLIRSVQPLQGLEVIARRRAGRKPVEWCSGPARLCSSFAIDGDLNGTVLCDEDSPLWINDAPPIPDNQVRVTPRVGIERTPEPWRSKPWRFIATLQESLTEND